MKNADNDTTFYSVKSVWSSGDKDIVSRSGFKSWIFTTKIRANKVYVMLEKLNGGTMVEHKIHHSFEV